MHSWIAEHPSLVVRGIVGVALLVCLVMARTWSYRRDSRRLRQALHDREPSEARLAMALEASDAAR